MKAEDILLALGEIDETLPPKCTKPVEKKTNEPPAPKPEPTPIPIESAKKKQNWRIIAGSLAACFAFLLASLFIKVPYKVPYSSMPSEFDQNAFSYPQTVEEDTTAPDLLDEMLQTTNERATQAPVPEQQQQTQDQSITARETMTAMVTTTQCEKHNWAPASCVAPRKCRVCGATEDTALNPKNHDPDTNGVCRLCGKEVVTAAATTKALTTACNHRWVESAIPCRDLPRCSICGATDTSASLKPHQSDYNATCVEPAHCTVCGTAIGSPNPSAHRFNGNDRSQCILCGKQFPGFADYPITGSTFKPSWNDKSIVEKYPEMSFNGKQYTAAASGSTDTGERLGEVTMRSSDGAPEHTVTAEVYSLMDDPADAAVLVRFPDGSICRYNAA